MHDVVLDTGQSTTSTVYVTSQIGVLTAAVTEGLLIQTDKQRLAADPNKLRSSAQAAMHIKRWDIAEADFRRLIELGEDADENRRSLALVLSNQGKHDEAVSTAQLTVLDRRETDNLSVLGTVLYHAGRYGEATMVWEAALERSPECAEVATNLASIYLQRGDFTRGWPLYMARLANESAQAGLLSSESQPHAKVWDGTVVPGKTLLVWGEQGVGDQVLWLSMLDSLRTRCKGMSIAIVVQRRLLPLVARSFKWLVVIAPGSLVMPAYDYEILLADLGRVVRPNLASFTYSVTPWLKTSAAGVALFRERYRKSRKVVGISWHSSRDEDGDAKSIDLKLLTMSSLRSIEGLALLVNCQYGAARAMCGPDIHTDNDVDGGTTDLDILAAQLKALDLLVTVSNATAHLAASLGVKVWLLEPLGKGSRWYWGTAELPSPWYKAVRVFHQTVPGDWVGPLAQMNTAFAEWVNGR